MKGSGSSLGGQGGTQPRVCSWGPRRTTVAKWSRSQGAAGSPGLAPSPHPTPSPIASVLHTQLSAQTPLHLSSHPTLLHPLVPPSLCSGIPTPAPARPYGLSPKGSIAFSPCHGDLTLSARTQAPPLWWP